MCGNDNEELLSKTQKGKEGNFFKAQQFPGTVINSFISNMPFKIYQKIREINIFLVSFQIKKKGSDNLVICFRFLTFKNLLYDTCL